MSNGSIQVDASFMQTLWNVHPTCSGSNITEGLPIYFFRNVYTLDAFVLYFIKSENENKNSHNVKPKILIKINKMSIEEKNSRRENEDIQIR